MWGFCRMAEAAPPRRLRRNIPPVWVISGNKKARPAPNGVSLARYTAWTIQGRRDDTRLAKGVNLIGCGLVWLVCPDAPYRGLWPLCLRPESGLLGAESRRTIWLNYELIYVTKNILYIRTFS